MAASRIVFAIGDLVAEIKRLVPDQEAPVIELVLDEPTFLAVVTEVENHYGQPIGRVQVGEKIKAPFGGVWLTTIIRKIEPVGVLSA